jgi:hypothetical protein
MVSLSLGRRRRILMVRAIKTPEDEKAIEEWLKHNEITICEAEAKTDPDEITYIYKAGSRGRKKKES